MGKKAGILSMQRVINYGSYLQAFALKQILLQHGAESVEFIDIKLGRQLKGYEHTGTKYYLRRLKALLKVIISGRLITKKRTTEFMTKVTKIQETWPVLGLSEAPCSPAVDIAIIGSDEVFHCCQSTNWGFTTQLYGNVPDAKEVVSYAASFGGTKLEMIKRLGIDYEIAHELEKLRFISVRDDNSKFIVKELTGRDAEINLDPVLAYGFNMEIENAPEVDESGYILIYSYPDRINDPNEINQIKEFARSAGKRLICVMSCYGWCDRAVIPSPLELLGWFKHADMVITETFHGTIFSIITERQFATIGRDSAMPKLTSMLRPYGLENRLVDKNNTIGYIFSNKIDYKQVNTVLKGKRKTLHAILKKF